MRLNPAIPFFVLILCAFKVIAQDPGFFIAPSALVGYSYISPIYHTVPEYAPANEGFNLAFQVGGVAGYKLKKAGVEIEYKNSNFQQHFDQGSLAGDLSTRYNTFGVHLLYQIAEINSSHYFHTVKIGYLYNDLIDAQYMVKDKISGEVYANENVSYPLQNDNMLSVEYGITRAYKLLWADFNLRIAYSITNIYKPLTGTTGKNFFIGFQLAFGLFANTNK